MTVKQLAKYHSVRSTVQTLVSANFVPAHGDGVPIWGHIQITPKSKAWAHLVSVRPCDVDSAVQLIVSSCSELSNVQADA